MKINKTTLKVKKILGILLVGTLAVFSVACKDMQDGLPSIERIMEDTVLRADEQTFNISNFVEREKNGEQNEYEKGFAKYEWSNTGSLNSYYTKLATNTSSQEEWWFPGESYLEVDGKISQESIEPRKYSLKDLLQLFKTIAPYLKVHKDPTRDFLYILSLEEKLAPLKENTTKGEYSAFDKALINKYKEQGYDFLELSGDKALKSIEDDEKQKLKEQLKNLFHNAKLAASKVEDLTVQLRFYISKENFHLLGVDVLFTTNDKNSEFYLSIVDKQNLTAEDKEKITAPKVNEKKERQNLTIEETKETDDKAGQQENIFANLQKIRENAQTAFDEVNQYETEVLWNYKVKEGQNEASGNLKVSGKEYYKDNKFLYFLGKEVRKKDTEDFSVAIALTEEKGYEKPLSSLNKEITDEKELQEEKEKENRLKAEGKITEKGWLLLENKLGVKYYQSLLDLLADEKLKSLAWTEEKQENSYILQHTIAGKEEIIFDFLAKVFGIYVDNYRELDLNGELKLTYDLEKNYFANVEIRVKSAHNEALEIEAGRKFADFNNDAIVDWPVDNK